MARKRKFQDWYPYYAPAEVVEIMIDAGITPAHCWIGRIWRVTDRDWQNDTPYVAIWGNDVPRFRQAVRRIRGYNPVEAVDGPSRELPNLAALLAVLDAE